MADFNLSYINHVDADATLFIASSGIALGLPASNLKNPNPGKRCRATSTTATVDLDFGSNVSVDVLALLFSRDKPFPGGTVQHQLDADGGTIGTGVAYDNTSSLGLTKGYGTHADFPPSTITARYWRMTFVATGVSFFDIGRAWLGPLYKPEFNVDVGYSEKWIDLSRKERAKRSSDTFIEEGERLREASFGFSAVRDAHRTDLREMERVIGTSKQVLAFIDPDVPSTEMILGRMEETNGLRHRPDASTLYEATYRLREF